MPELVADCPRCGARRITFDLTQDLLFDRRYRWQEWYEAFCVCRHCHRSTVFVLSQSVDSDKEVVHQAGLTRLQGSVNDYMNVERYISLKDVASTPPPEHLPAPIESAFMEGAICLAVSCYNAAATMFRLCLDIATRSLLPEGEAPGLNPKTRRDLGLRLPWLFDNGLLPLDLRDLSTSVKEEGNEGAHIGSLTDADAEDILDFTVALLERMYTEPERIRLAADRRAQRRAAKPTE
jgi:hypothetical protein